MTTKKIEVFGNKGGKGGGGTTRAAQEAPNTLQSRATARVIDIISHGECIGLANRENPLRSVFYDGLPIENADGSKNWRGVEIQERLGLPDQDPFVGFDETEEEININLEVTTTSPRAVRITDAVTDALRIKIRIPTLTKQNKENGDLNGTAVSFKIQSRIEGGSWTDIVNERINAKCTTPQELSYRIDKPEGTGEANWEVRVIRLTPDSTDVTLQNKTYLGSATKLIEAKLQYADFAGVAQAADSEQFGDRIPPRAFDWVGMVLDVPSNYIAPDYDDPLNQSHRLYPGLWDGTFKRAWTDNPAWILWGMLTDREWGLGRVINPGQVDKWALYQIAKYCDEFVSDGNGGYEPRYRINTQITSSEQAYAMLQSIASIFRGMAYWGSGSVTFTSDQPSDSVKLVSPANVLEGEFTYTGTALKNRHSSVRVSWNDPQDNFKLAIEIVEDPEMILRYGHRPANITAFGCTSRSQAIRMGRWMLDTERYETETVTYRASFDHADVRPGQIIEVYDPHYAGVRMGGRITAITNTSVTIDAPIEIEDGETYEVNLVRPDGSLVTRALTNGIGSTSTLTWADSLATLPSGGTALIFSTAIATQRDNMREITSTSVTFVRDIEIDPTYTYYVGFTLEDGTVVNRPLSSPASGRAFTWTTPLSILPSVESIAFVYAPSEGYVQVTLSDKTATSATISSPYTFIDGYDYEAIFSYADGTKAYRKLTNSPGSSSSITWTESLTDLPILGSMWGVVATNLAPRKFRVLSVREVEQHIFEVSALTYDENKYARIEDGLVLPPPQTTIYTSTEVPEPPTNLTGYRRPTVIDGVYSDRIHAFWDRSTSNLVTHYRVSYRKDDGEWTSLPDTFTNAIDFASRGPGLYIFSIRAVNVAGRESLALYDAMELLDERPFGDPVITNIHIENELSTVEEWTGNDLKVAWDVEAPADWWEDVTTGWEDPYLKDYVVTVKDDLDNVLATFYTKDRRFVLSKERGTEINGGTPLRDVRIEIAFRDLKNVIHPGSGKTFNNPAPDAPASVEVQSAIRSLFITVPRCPELDYSSTRVWVSTTDGFDPLVTAPVLDLPQNNFTLDAEPGETYYIRVAYLDDFSSAAADLNISSQITHTVSSLSSGDLDLTPPAVPTGLALTSTLVLDNTNTQYVKVKATWTEVSDEDLAYYEISLTEAGGGAIVYTVAPGAAYEWNGRAGVAYTARIRAVDIFGNASAYTSIVAHTAATDAVAPAAPTSITVTAALSTLWLSWSNASAADLTAVEVWENTTNSSGTATLIDVVTVLPSTTGKYSRSGLASGVTRYYWLKSVDSSNNKSAFSTVASGTTATVSGADFTPGLTGIERVDALPSTSNFHGRLVFLTTDNKLYRWTSSSVTTGTTHWSTAVPAVDITGQITDDQILEIDTSKLVGDITNDQIESITANKISDVLAPTQVPGLDAAKIISGAFDSTRIADQAITAAKFATGLAPVESVAALPSTGNFRGRIVMLQSDGKLYRWNSTTTTGTSFWSAAVPAADVSGQLTNSQIADIDATKLTGQIVAAQIANGAITSAKLFAGLAAIESVAALPSTGNFQGRTVMLQSDGKLYRWNSATTTGTSFWVSSVPATDVTGTLTNSQIADIAATKITGQIVANQITDGIITNAKLFAGLSAIESVAALPSTGNFRGRTVMLQSDGKLYRWNSTTTTGTSFWSTAVPTTDLSGTITTTQITDDAITTDKIAANAVTAAEIAANTITAGQIATGAITADEVAAGAISAAKIAAGAVTTSKLLVGDTTNLVTDSELIDPASWDLNSGWTFGYTDTDVTGILGYPRAIKSISGNGTTSQGNSLARTQVITQIPVEPGKEYRFFTQGLVSAGFTGLTRLFIYWFKQDQTGSTITAASSIFGTDYRTVAATTATLDPIEGRAVAPADARFARFSVLTGWSTTQNNAGYVLFAGMRMHRAVSGELIVDGAITADKISAGAITAGKIGANTITAAEIATGAITADELAANAVTATKILAGTITGDKIAATTITGDRLVAGTIQAAQIAANTITAAQIAANTITATEIASNAVTADEIAANTITAAEIASATITGDRLVANTITAAQIAANTITATQIASNAITADELAANAVTAAKIVAGNIQTAHLASQSVTASKLFIGDTSNVFPDPHLVEESPSTVVLSSTLPNAATIPQTSTYAMKHTVAGTSRYSQFFPVEAGKTYWGSIVVDFDPGETAGGIFQMYWYDSNQVGISPANAVIANVTAAQGPGHYQGSVTAPAGAAYARTRMAATGTMVSAVYTSSPYVRRAADGQLIVDGAITASKIAADTITAEHIASNTITASKLVVSDTSNMCPDPNMEDLSSWTASSTTPVISPPTTSVASKNVLRIQADAAAIDLQSTPIAIEPVKDYYVSCSIQLGSGTGSTVSAFIYWYSMDFTTGTLTFVSASAIGSAVSTAPSFTRVSGIVTAPSNARRARILYRRAAGGTAFAYFGEPIFRRASSGELIVDGAITADKIAANAVTADKIIANAITATKISAGAVTASKLTLVNTSNLVPNPKFTFGSTDWFIGTNSSVVPATTAGIPASAPSDNVLMMVGAGNSSSHGQHVTTTPYGGVNVTPGEEYYISAVSAGSGAITGTCRIHTWYNSSSGNLSGTFANLNTTGTWTKAGMSVTIPAGYTQMQVFIARGGSGGVLGVTDVQIIRRSSAELIVDGAITTDKLAANAITAGKIAANTITAAEIATGAITADEIATNAVTAVKIQAGTITGDKLVAGTIQAAQIASGAITASKLFIGDTANMIPDGNLADPSAWNGSLGTFTFTNSVSAATSTKQVNIPADAAAFNILNAVSILIEPSTSYYVSTWFTFSAGTVPATGASVAVVFYSEIGGTETFITSVSLGSSTAAGRNKISGQFVSPAGAVRAKIYMTRGAGGTAPLAFDSPIMRRAISGELVVDGAITTNHMTAGSINADRITAGTITGDRFNTGTSLPGTITVGTTGVSIDTITENQRNYTWVNNYVLAGGAGQFIKDIKNVNITPASVDRSSAVPMSFLATAVIVGTTTNTEAVVRFDWSGSAWTLTKITEKGTTSNHPEFYLSGGVPAIKLYNNASTYTARVIHQVFPTDTAALVNSNSTTIDPGKILISGATTLSNWRNGTDATKIEGGSIAANTITANKLSIGSRNLSFSGVEFEHNKPGANQVSWSAGTITYVNDAGATVAVSTTASSTTWSSGTLYLYWVKDATTISATTSAGTAMGANNVILATYAGGTNLVVNYGRTIIDGAHIKTGTVDANQIAANAITTAKLNAGAVTADKITAGTITGDRIAATTITGDRLVANTITATQIAAGTITATQIAATTITAAKIAANTITAAQIAANTITAAEIAADTITAAQIAANAITVNELAANAVTTSKIAAGAITADIIATGTLSVSVNVGSSGKILLDGPNNRIVISD